MFWNKKTTWDLGAALLASIILLAVGASIGRADFTFGVPVSLGPTINNGGESYAPCMSADGLELYWHRGEVGDMWVARRTTPDSEWGPPSLLDATVNSPNYDGGPCLSADGLQLYFFSNRPGTFGSQDLWVTTRATAGEKWGTPVNLGATVNSAGRDFTPSITADGLELYFSSERPGYGSWDLWVTSRATVDGNWGTPVNLGPVINTSANENWCGISPDGLLLVFSSDRPGGVGSWDIYVTQRATTNAPWGPPQNLGPMVNSNTHEVGGKISFNGSMLYFHSWRPGGFSGCDLWQTPITPIVDFNADGKVDLVDLVMLIDNWGTNKTLCDIGPMPWGDGKVDIEDLKVFMTYFEKENPPVKP